MFISPTGPISYSNLQNMLGQPSSRSVSIGNMYGVHPSMPISGQISLTNLKGLKAPSAIFQSFRPDVQSATLGLYSVRLANSNYTGAVVNLRRSSDNGTLDFYADYMGNLKASDGSTYASWSNGTISVMTWYDQSGGARNATATSASGGNPPQFVTDPSGTNKYVIYFPNGSATASAYYGFSMTAQSVASMMCSYYTVANSSGYQSLLCTNNDNQGVRFYNNLLQTGDVNDFMNPGGFVVYDGTYANTSPYMINTNGAWHTMCASRSSGSMSIIHIGHCDVSYSSGALLNRSFYGYMSDMYTFNAALPTISQGAGTNNPEYQILLKNRHIPFWRNGLIGCYTPESWNGSQWMDLSTSSNHATTITGTITSTNTASNNYGLGGLPYLNGGTADSIQFPAAILPSSYTIFHLTRYTSTIDQARILTNPSNTNWLSGHHSGKSGVAYHNGWMTNTNKHGTNWVLSTDLNTIYRSQGTVRSTTGAGSPSYATPIGVNLGWAGGEKSQWGIACVLVYNRNMPTVECLAMEDMLASRYSVPIPIPEGLVLSLDANDYTSGSTTWYDRTGLGYNFTLPSTSIYVSSGSFPYMDSSGLYATIYNSSDVPYSTYTTWIFFCSLKNSTSNWRTLLRGNSADHQVLISNGGNSLGCYDNSTSTFVPCDTTVDVSTLSSVYTRFNMWAFVLSTVSPYYTFYFNPTSHPLTATGTITTNTKAQLKNGVGRIGSHSSAQHWGNIGTVLCYHRKLSDAELVETYNRYKFIYGLP